MCGCRVRLDLVLCLPWGAGRAPEEAHGRLRDLLSRCAPQRLTRLFLVPLAHPAFLPLLEQEVEEGTSGPFAAETLAALSAWPAAQSSAGRIAPSGTSNVLAIRQGTPGTSRPALQAVPSPVRPPAPRRPSGPAADAQFRYVPEAEQAAPRAPVPPLTSREVEVLGRLARGDSYLDIAQALYITQNTVKTHVAALYRKLNAGKRSEALRTAWALGLLTEIAPASPDPGQARAERSQHGGISSTPGPTPGPTAGPSARRVGHGHPRRVTTSRRRSFQHGRARRR